MNKHLPVLIIGGGISGITAAVELAETGRKAVLVEKEPCLGGKVSLFNNYFPKMCPPSCGLEINYRRIRSNPRIQYYTGAEVIGIEGRSGQFRVTVALGARLINNRCTSCGECAAACPVPGAIRVPGGLSFPRKYTIDASLCEREQCKKCEEVCSYDAIQLNAVPTEVEISVSAVIAATGWESYPAAAIEGYRYAEEPDVITNMEFEEMLAESSTNERPLARPSDGKRPERIAFVQCAGSRDRRHLPYCSAVCCSASLKQALTLVREYRGIETTIYYIDLRVPGRNETLLREAQEEGSVRFIRGKVGRILEASGDGRLEVEVEDIAEERKSRESFDMVVLAVGMVPNPAAPGVQQGRYGFLDEAQQPGIICTSSSTRPMDVAASVRDATAAALKAIQI